MKRTIVVLLALLMLLGLSACGEKIADSTDTVLTDTEEAVVPEIETTEAVACEHDYTKTILSHPDCIVSGLTLYTCKICGGEFTEEVPALGHEGSGASCTEVAICANCGDVAEAAWGHLDRNGICENCGISLLGPESTQNTEATETTQAAQ